ncbi:MAG TPA: PIN domain-containing protein [Chthoniobacterales bacterium]|nr:PIN domain-containing protein [Chthoniobacterales bacterium]
MIYLLDINALLALVFVEHEFHVRVDDWIGKLLIDAESKLATSAITELGFVRIASTVPAFGVTYSQARAGLTRLESDSKTRFVFLSDNLGVDRLPPWVKTGKQITDGHLVELARTHGAKLATCDKKIPGALLIH